MAPDPKKQYPNLSRFLILGLKKKEHCVEEYIPYSSLTVFSTVFSTGFSTVFSVVVFFGCSTIYVTSLLRTNNLLIRATAPKRVQAAPHTSAIH